MAICNKKRKKHTVNISITNKQMQENKSQVLKHTTTKKHSQSILDSIAMIHMAYTYFPKFIFPLGLVCTKTKNTFSNKKAIKVIKGNKITFKQKCRKGGACQG